MSNITEFRVRKNAAERRELDAQSLVATISDGKNSWQAYRIYAPAGYGTPTVELAHGDLPGRIRLTPQQAAEIGAALIEAAKRASE